MPHGTKQRWWDVSALAAGALHVRLAASLTLRHTVVATAGVLRIVCRRLRATHVALVSFGVSAAFRTGLHVFHLLSDSAWHDTRVQSIVGLQKTSTPPLTPPSHPLHADSGKQQ